MSEIQSGVKNVRREIAIVAGPKDWGDTRESWLGRVPRKVKRSAFERLKLFGTARFQTQNTGLPGTSGVKRN
jgi:hypothetical protein